MVINKPVILLPCVLYLLQISTFCLSSQIPITHQNGLLGKQIIAKSPKVQVPIEACGTTLCWRETAINSQSGARSNCANWGRQLIRLRNQDHLLCVIFEGGVTDIDGSWTDGITFYERSMFRPEVSSTIQVQHYSPLALRIDAFGNKLVVDYATYSKSSICCRETIPDGKANKIPAIEKQKVLVTEEVIRVEPVPILPHAISYLGEYGGYQYFQESSILNQDMARINCEANSLQLATFPTKQHLDYVISRGAVDESWTAHFGDITRDLLKWGNGDPIHQTIQIEAYPAAIGLTIRIATGNHRLQASSAVYPRPSICMLHVA